MRYRKTDFNLPFAPSVLRPCVIDFLTATIMLQAFAMALALLSALFILGAIENLSYDLFPVFGIIACFRRP